MNYKIVIPTLAVVALMAGLIFTGSARAEGETDQFPPMVQRLVEKFDLNTAQVQQVMDEVRSEHQQKMEVRLEENLTQAVTDGKITEEQKQAITAKHEQMQVKHEELKNLSPEERREKMQAWHEEMRQWAEDQGIDLPGLMGPFGRGFKQGMRMGYRLGNQ